MSIGPNTDRRIGISKGEFVVLDKTRDGLYHGHVRSWSELDQKICKLFLEKLVWSIRKGILNEYLLF
ncbi:hypothetical protein D3C80_1991820 [compost metagenome]